MPAFTTVFEFPFNHELLLLLQVLAAYHLWNSRNEVYIAEKRKYLRSNPTASLLKRHQQKTNRISNWGCTPDSHPLLSLTKTYIAFFLLSQNRDHSRIRSIYTLTFEAISRCLCYMQSTISL